MTIGLALGFGLALGGAVVAIWRLRLLREEHLQLQSLQDTTMARAIKAEANVESFQALRTQMQSEFEIFTRRQMEESQERLKVWSKESFQTMVNPVDQELKALQTKIRDVYDKEARERLSLKAEIEFMMKAQNQLSQDAHSLTKALRGDVKSQGLWGEVILERVLEASGLREGEEFIVQGRGLGLKSEEGQIRRPDVLIRLPGDRHLIIDSKVSLTAFEAYSRAESDNERAMHLQEFQRSLRRHIEDLAAKDYSQLYGVNSPDFVMLFVPTDGAFSLAHQSDPELFNMAMNKRVAVVSPSLLFPNLRTVEAIWRQERQNRNAEEIARQAGGLYDKFAGLLDDLSTLESHLRRAQETREGLMGKLKDGKGNLMDRVEKLRALGARTKKRLEVEAEL